jgi:hypothetical protein
MKTVDTIPMHVPITINPHAHHQKIVLQQPGARPERG